MTLDTVRTTALSEGWTVEHLRTNVGSGLRLHHQDAPFTIEALSARGGFRARILIDGRRDPGGEIRGRNHLREILRHPRETPTLA